MNADWPGNIRQLENFIERCVIFTRGDELNVLSAELQKPPVRPVASAAPNFEQAERQVIIDALMAASGRIAGKGGAAERLGLGPNDTPKQDEQTEYQSRRLLQDKKQATLETRPHVSSSKRPLRSMGFRGRGNRARITALPVGRARVTLDTPRRLLVLSTTYVDSLLAQDLQQLDMILSAYCRRLLRFSRRWDAAR